MGKIPSYAIIIAGLVLIIGVSVLFYMMPVKRANEQIDGLEQTLAGLQSKAATLDQARNDLAKAKEEAGKVEVLVEQAMAQRSIPISFLYPVEAFINLWPEYTENIPSLVRRFVAQSGCDLVTPVISLPEPPMAPVEPPANGFLQIPPGQSVQLTVLGTLPQIERLYRSLRTFPRVATISGLSLSGSGENLTATFSLTIYLIVEVPEAAPVAAAAAPMGAGGVPGAPGGMPGMPGPPGGMPPGSPGGMPGMPGPPGMGGGGPGMGAPAAGAGDDV